MGWNHLAHELYTVDYDPRKYFLFGDQYQTTAILSFYGEGQKQAYFLNLNGIRRNQYSYWPGMAQEQVGKSGYFVVVENGLQTEEYQSPKVKVLHDRLAPYFKQVHFLGRRPLFVS